MKRILSLILLVAGFSSIHAQFTVTTGGGGAAVTAAVGGPGVTISNVTINCDANGYGSFNGGGGSGMGMNNGLVLTTGNASGVPGGNGEDDFSTCINTTSTDPQLASVVGPYTIYDACIIEFDVVPQCNTMSITFVFGSDEYMNWVGQTFNDAFGFFVSGPNPSGGSYTNQNIAVLPSGTVVSIDNVNSSSADASYYVDNTGANNHFDGYTTVISPVINVTPCATYHFKLAIGDAYDCLVDSGVLIDLIQCVSPWTVATSTTPASSCSANDGTATATVSGGIGPFTYSWAPIGGTGATATGLAPGTYTVTVDDGLACTPPQPYTAVVGGPAGTPVASNSPTICDGQTATLTATPTVGGGTFAWSTGGTAASINVNPATTTTYTVTYTLGGCSTFATGTVTVNPVPVATPVMNQTYCPGDPVPASTFTSAPAGATFNWTNSNTATGLGASGTGDTPAFTAANASAATITSTVTVTPVLTGCTGLPINYNIIVNPNPTAIVPATITACSGDNIASSVLSSNPSGGTFTWTNSDPSIGLSASGSGNIPAFTASNTGTAPVTAIITVTPSLNGCTGTPNSFNIVVNPIPAPDPVADITVCNGVLVPAGNFTSATAGSTFAWTNSNTAIGLAASGSGNTPSFNGVNASGTAISGMITITPTANGCTGTSGNYTITVSPNLVVSAGADDTICFAGNTVLNASPGGAGYTFAWSPATGLSNTNTFNPTASPASTTTYNVVITDALGCSGNDDVVIYSDPEITLAKTAIDVTCNGACNGQTIVIPAGGTGPYTYSWTGGCTSAACNTLCPGSYTVTVTDAWGCTANTDTVVTEPPALIASITSATPATCNTACDGTATGAAAGGTPGSGYSFSWNTVPVQNTAAAGGLCAGMFILTVTDANSCIDTVHANVIEPSPVTNAPIAGVIICNGSSTTLTAAGGGGTGGYTYAWDEPGNAGFASTAAVTVSPLTTTTYTVHVTDANGCIGPDVTVTVTVSPALSVIASGATSICPGGSATISAVASGGNGVYTYNWAPSGTGTPLTVSPLVTTTYTVTVSDGCGSPTATDVVTITVLPVPTVVINPDVTAGCEPLCVNFFDGSTVTGGTITSWNWDLGDGTLETVQNPSHCYDAGLYSVTLTVTSNSGCSTTYTALNLINSYALPDAGFYMTPQPTSVINTEVEFHNTSSSDVVSWYWEFGDATDLGYTTSDPTHVYPDVPNTYIAQLTVLNANGCMDSETHFVYINPEFTFFIPNAFTPNGDGINDEFFGTGVGIGEYELTIFDRWGNLIFFADDLYEKWDGKANHGSEKAQQDVYVWKVKLTDVFGKKHSYIGTVTIVK